MAIKNDKDNGCHWKSVEEMGKLDPKVREGDITYNSLHEKSAFLPDWVVFLPSAKHASVSAVTWENYKSNTYVINYDLELFWETLNYDVNTAGVSLKWFSLESFPE